MSEQRKIRLVPVDTSAAKTDGVSPVGMAKIQYEKAMRTVGPEGIGDAEAQMTAAAEVRDKILNANKGNTSTVRLCDMLCPYRAGGQPGCEIYQERQRQGVDIDGTPCERDLLYLASVKKVIEEGDEDKVRSLAGEFTGQILIQIRKLFDQIITDGTVVEEPILDAKGTFCYDEVPETDRDGNTIYDKETGRAVYRKVLLKRKKEHPAFARLTQLLKETRLINLTEWQLTPKSSGTPPPTDGMILLEETQGGTTKTVAVISKKMEEGVELLREALKQSQSDRVKDPAYKAIVAQRGMKGDVANRGSI